MEAFFWIPVSWYSFWQLCQSTDSQQVASLSSEDHLAFVVQGQILWAIFAHICLQLMLFQKRNKDCFQACSTISTVKCFKKRTHSNRRITLSWDNFLIGQNLLVTLRHLDTNDEKALLGEVQRVQQSINPIRPIRRCAWVGERFVQFCGECPNQTILQGAAWISHLQVVPLGLSEIEVKDDRCQAEEIPAITYVVRPSVVKVVREAWGSYQRLLPTALPMSWNWQKRDRQLLGRLPIGCRGITYVARQCGIALFR